jgi:hypothetical protein
MECRNCGAEIADKAIVCYRCGAGTTDPVRAPAPIPRRGAPGPPLSVGLAPLVLALVLAVVAPSTSHAHAMTEGAEVSAVAGVVALVTRLVRRR